MSKFVVKERTGYVNFVSLADGTVSEYETSSKKSDAVELNEYVATFVASELSGLIEVAEFCQGRVEQNEIKLERMMGE